MNVGSLFSGIGGFDYGRVAHGVPDRLDQLAALGNALVPQIAEWLGGRILEWESSVTS